MAAMKRPEILDSDFVAINVTYVQRFNRFNYEVNGFPATDFGGHSTHLFALRGAVNAALLLQASQASAAAAKAFEALREASATLNLSKVADRKDKSCYDSVQQLGRTIGFGALMAQAELAWRNELIQADFPPGGEFVRGPSRSTVDATLKQINEAIEELQK